MTLGLKPWLAIRTDLETKTGGGCRISYTFDINDIKLTKTMNKYTAKL